MIKKKVSLKDIAEHCGLAATTVSRILNGKSTYCSEAKIAMVKQIAAEWEYHPHVGYNIMTGKETNIAGIIFSQTRSTFSDQNNRLYMRLTQGLNKCNLTAYTVIMDGDRESQLKKIYDLDERGCRYYIFIGNPEFGEPGYDFLRSMNRHMIGFNNMFLSRSVNPDESGVFIRYFRMAASEGRKNFKLALSDEFFYDVVIPGLSEKDCQVLKDALYPGVISPQPLDSCDDNFIAGKQAMQEIIRTTPECDAVCFHTDYHALGAAQAIAEAGKSTEDIRVFGIGDATVSRFSGVHLTTAAFDMDYAGDKILASLSGTEVFNCKLEGRIIEYPLKIQ